MICVWSHRPQFLHLGFFVVAYVLGCGFAQSLAIVPGTGISIWPPGGLLMATLILASRHSWPWWVLGGLLAELFSNFLWFHSPLPAAVLIYAGNALEAAAGAWLVIRICGRPVRLETLQEVLAFVVLGAGIAPVISATVGSATLAWFGIQSQSFTTAWPLWWIGDATGVLIVAPLALVVLQNWRGKAQLSVAQWMEACVLGLIFLGVAALSLSGYLPFAYIIMPPLLWAAVRFEFKGAAVSLTLLAMITAVFTISGASQFAGDPESQKHKQVMLQLFLAVSAFSALIVAAISRQHQLAVLTLRQSVEELRDRERELSQLVNMVPVQIRRLTPAGEPTFFNKRLIDFFGLDVGDLDKPGMSRLAAIIQSLVHPDDAVSLLQTARHSFVTGESFSMKYRMRRADGAYRWVDGRGEPLRDQHGAIAQWYVISIEIDDEMRAQEALRDRERELSQLVDMVPSLLWRLSPEGEPTFFNKRLIDFFGLDVGDLDKPGMSRLAAIIEAAVHPDDAASLREALNHSFVTGERFSKTYRLRRADGVYRWVEGSAEPLLDESGRILQWYGLSHDIDDQLRVEEALRRSERQLQQLIDTVPVQIWCVTPGGEPAYINKTMMDYIGLKLEDFDAEQGLAGAIQAIVHPDDRIPLERALTHSFSTGEAFELKFRNRRWDGSYRWTEGRADPLRDESGRIIRWYGANVDIHDFVISQEALRERERSLWELVETLPVMIDCAAPDGEPLYRSRQLREFLGYELEELDGTGKSRLAGTLDAGVHPDDVAGVKERYAHSLSTGEPYARKHRLRRFDGEYRWVDTRAAAMRNAEGAIVQWNVICLDIDGEIRAQGELRLAQESLARASQAASLAELSASIAHEVNQPLAAVVANSHACQRWLTAQPPNLERAQKTVERIIRDANAAADVVSRIRALFKQSVETRHATALDSVIADARDLTAEEAARRRVRMDVDVESNLPPVTLDRVQIQQVLVNLIRNGMEAMDTITTDRVLRIRARRRGHAVETEISDLGRGVESPDKIFEPFFTTKAHGMGMGLAICRSIVESHGGRLWAEKNQPHGATFVFTLPDEVGAE
ncbi:MASE1 domain-containing protein [Rhizobium mongolense]|uniref:histidine kinase n=2 Tax=Rhizobium mongolense TaxID=57676 RepID=A0A559TH01_9HYPH|nr:MASE1 domain-containing protein [Rhizobium mongolense]TVZ73876.1 PAS domain S-box-containing protein [Rhizobium mongolense USDA 1844]